MSTNRRVSLVALAVLLCAGTDVSAQRVSGVFGPQVGIRPAAVHKAIVTIGDGINSTGSFTGTDELPFVQAFGALAAGGTLIVGPGVYSFVQPVTLTTANVTVRGAGAVLQASADVSTGVFQVNADGVRIEGLEFRQDAPTTSQALLRVTASGFHLRDARFVGTDAFGLTPDFVLLQGQPGDTIEDVWIEAVEFVPHRGWTVVRARDLVGLHLTGNSVSNGSAATAPTPGFMRYGFHFHDVTHGEVRGNTFLDLGSDADPIEAAIFAENENGEGHHLVIANNALHGLAARRLIHLRASFYNVLANNSLGRMLSTAMIAALEIGPNANGDSGTSTTITGNDFHNATAPMILINGGSGYHIASNNFQFVGGPGIVIGDTLPASRVSVIANQLVATSGANPPLAVSIQGGASHAVLSCSMIGFALPTISVSGVAPGQSMVANNFTN